MNKTTIYAVLVGTLLSAAATSEALAWVKNFPGTRTQVRTACAAVGGELIEGASDTTCLNNKNGTGVSCGNDGTCTGSGAGPTPRHGIPIHGILGQMSSGEKVELEFTGMNGFGSRSHDKLAAPPRRSGCDHRIARRPAASESLVGTSNFESAQTKTAP